MGRNVELAVAVLNGLIGDYLARTRNGLATEMSLILRGRPLPIDAASLGRAYPGATPRVALLVHGLMNTESVWEMADGSDYGALLARDLGYTPLYLRYNSGRPIAENGAALAGLLESLAGAYPAALEEIVPIGHSMGGLITRSACRAASAAGHRWLGLVRRAISIGTPHRGAPLERAGRTLARILRGTGDPYVRLVGEIGDLRSAGLRDLGDACQPDPLPLLSGIRRRLIAGTLSRDPRLAAILGDGIVPVPSATDGACVDRTSLALPPDPVKVVPGVGHVALAHHPAVYAHVRAFCEEAA